MEKEKLWTKDFLIVSAINFLVSLVMYLLLVTIAPYAVKEFNASTSVAGLISGIFIIGTLIGRLATGRVIGRIGGKKILITGLIFFTLTSCLYYAAMNIPLLLITRLLHGIGLGISSTATGTIAAQIIPSNRRGEGIGYFSMSTVMATAIGPFMGIYLSQHTSYPMIFFCCLIFSLISLITAFTVKSTPHQKETTTNLELPKRFKLSNFLEVKALPISFVTVIIALCYSGVLSFLAFYGEKIHLVTAASFFFLVYAVAVLLSRPFTGKLMDVKGANMVVYPALLIFGIGMLILSRAENSFILLLAGAVIGLGFGNFQSCAQAIAIRGMDHHRLGLATSTFFIFLDLGFGVGPYLLGTIIPVTGYRVLYSLLALIIVLSIVLYFFLCGKRDTEHMQGLETGVFTE